jgi:hypothetical protein
LRDTVDQLAIRPARNPSTEQRYTTLLNHPGLQTTRTGIIVMSKRAMASTRRRTTTACSIAGSVVFLTALFCGALATTSPSTHAYGTKRSQSARAAHVLNTTDTAHLHYVRSSGSLLFEEGSASGTLPGKMLAHFNIGPTVSASFTIYVRGGGTIKGHGAGSPHGSGIYESFAGSLVATGGTGRYSHARGHAGLYGVFNRRTYAIVVQTTGRLSY